MQSKKLAGSKPTNSTQLNLDIAEVRNDTVVLKDGTLRAVLMVSSVNFALKSEDEQNAIISSYVSFLNYLDFSIQIVIQSRKLNIDNYLKRLKEKEKEQTNDLLRMQIIQYQQYIRELVDIGDIMSKRFFIVIPYSPITDEQKNFFERVGELFTPGKVIKLNQEKFEKYKRDLEMRVEHVTMNISSMGLSTVRLDTQSLIELYYNSYNPDVSENQRLVDMDKLRVEE